MSRKLFHLSRNPDIRFRHEMLAKLWSGNINKPLVWKHQQSSGLETSIKLWSGNINKALVRKHQQSSGQETSAKLWSGNISKALVRKHQQSSGQETSIKLWSGNIKPCRDINKTRDLMIKHRCGMSTTS